MNLQTITATIAIAAGAATAQDLGLKAAPQDRPVLITGVTIHPVSDPVIEDGALVFEGGTIAAIGPADRVRAPRGAAVADFAGQGRHVYPGLFLAESNLGLREWSSVRDTIDENELGDASPEARAAVAVNPDSTLLPVARANGILLAATYPTGGTFPGQAAVIRLDGWTSEDMTIDANAGVVITWPRIHPFGTRDTSDQEKRTTEALRKIDQMFEDAAAYTADLALDPTAPRDLALDAIATALPGDNQAPVLIRANAADQITSAIQWATSRGLDAVIVGGAEADLVADQLVSHDIPVILRGPHSFPRRSDSAYDESYTLPARLKAAGVTFAIDSSEENAHTRGLPYEAAMAARHGVRTTPAYTPADALHAITLAPAIVYGLDDRYGSLEEGKSATLIVTDGPVLEITSNVHHAFIDGREIALSSKHTALRDKYTTKYKQRGLIDDDVNP